MLYVPSFDLDEQCGLWSRTQLEDMDAAFVAAVRAAFDQGLESRAAASATIDVKAPSLNGNARRVEAAIEAVIEKAWDLLCSKEGEIAFSEIVVFVRERVPNIELDCIRFGFEQRFKQRGREPWAEG